MPSAFTPTKTARTVAIARAGSAGKSAALDYLQSNEDMQNWSIGESLDFYADLCKYSDKVAPLIGRLAASEVIPSKDRAVLRSAIGAVQTQLRKLVKDEKASAVANAEYGPIMLDVEEIDGEEVPVTRYILKREA